MALSILSLACAAAVACWDDQQAPTGPPRVEANVQRDTGLAAVADSWIEQDVPNINHGTSNILRIRLTGKNRALLRWDQQVIQQVVGMDSLVSATLELTYSQPALYWEQGAKLLSLYRLTQTWTEAGATWNCAVDEVPGNGVQNCGGSTAWNMTSAPPIVTTATASFLVQNGSSGTVQLNVTGDVRAWLAGTAANHGWLLKKELENISGLAEFGSRESGTPPRLVLSILSADTSVPPIPNGSVAGPGPFLEITSPTDSRIRYNRNRYEISFAPATSGVTIHAFLTQFSGVIVGGLNLGAGEGYYIVQVPDPGTTWAAMDSLVQRMLQHPGVTRVNPSASRAVILRGRYPTDAAVAATRAAWFEPNLTTWAWKAVRAPLAWGCETGLYGGRLTRVGVIDLYFDSLPNDLASSLQAIVVPPDTAMRPNADWFLDGTLERNHGIGVAGIIAARGDNDTGTVGMVWRSALRTYVLRRANSITTDELTWAAGWIVQAGMDSVNVLNLSWGLGLVTDQNHVRTLREAIKRFLDSGTRRLIVVATGNTNLTMTVAALRQTTDTNATALDRALAQLHDTVAYRDKILFVTGVDRQGARYFSSNVWTGADMLAAPADSVLTLSGRSGTQWGSFTSFATPFVSGAAAQLWSFDSSLTGAEVKQFLMQGAQEQRISTTTGAPVTPQPVPNAGGAYLLDAYGSLVRAARLRGGSPVCGYPVRLENAFNASVTLESGGPSQRALPVPGLASGENAVAISVAQGGRLIAAHVGGPATRTIVMNHLGASVGAPINGVQRHFLEKDTADQAFDAQLNYPLVTLRGPSFPGGLSPLNLFSQFLASRRPEWGGWLLISPVGDYALVWYGVTTPCSAISGYVDESALLASIPGPGSTLVATGQWAGGGCAPPENSQVYLNAWSHDGRRAVVQKHIGGNPSRSGWAVVEPPSSVRAPVWLGDFGANTSFTADDSLMIVFEFDYATQSCRRQFRRPATPEQTVGAALAVAQAECFAGYSRPNAPPAVADGARARGRFDLFPGIRRVRSSADGARVVQIN